LPCRIDEALLMDPRILRIERVLTPRNARLVLAVLAALTLVFGAALRHARLDHDFEKFFPTDDPELDRYLAFRERFGHDNEFLLIGIPAERSVFDTAFLAATDRLVGRLLELPHVRSVASPTRLAEPRITPIGVFQAPWLRFEADSLLRADSVRVWSAPFVRDLFFAPDAKALLLLLTTEPGLAKEPSDSLMVSMEDLVARSGLPGIRVGGRIHGQYWYIKKMQHELVLFFTLSVVLLALFLAIGFRTAWGVLVPIGVVGLTVLWQVGLLALLGKPLSILTMLLPTILFVVGMSDAVHIIERYIEALRGGHPKARALAIAYHEVGLATFLTSITTAIGFATLMTSGIPPVREFGLYTGAGVMLAFALAFTLLPAVLLLVRTPLRASANERDTLWYPLLHRLYRFVLRRSKAIGWSAAALCVLALVGTSALKVDNFLLEDWPDDDPQKQDYFWFERHFGGVRPFELEAEAADGAWELPALREMEAVHFALERGYGVHGLQSPVTVMKSMNKAMAGGAAEAYRLPDSSEEARRLARFARAALGRDALRAVADSTGRFARITGRMVDEGGHAHRGKNAVLDAFIAGHTGAVRFKQTGMAYLIDRNNEKLSAQLIGGLAIAFALIAGIMALVFRDARMTIVALIPNVVPLLLVGGIMGALGIDIKVSTSIIFTIAFGIAVDDTIHLLGKLRIELKKGRSLPWAMRRSFLSTGKAVIVTTIMLLSGFVSLIASGFASVHYMGLLVSLTLLLALVCDLLLLPVLVLGLLRRR
jgi:hypothetical protein